jgi:photosystem II stability/assembly factor-like uncharacterized protein
LGLVRESYSELSQEKPVEGLISYAQALGAARRFAMIMALLAASFLGLVSPPAQAATGIRQLDEPAISVRMPDKAILIAITRAGSRLVAVGEHGLIIYSDDSGRSWRQASVPVSVLLTAVAFATPSVGWAVGHFGVILHTATGGATWQLQLNGIQANQLTLDAAQQVVVSPQSSAEDQHALRRANFFVAAGPNKPFLTILALDEKNAIVFGAYRLAMKTDDGGKTWTDWSLHILDPISHNLYDVARVGADIFIAGEAGNDFVSTDGGANFTSLASASPTAATMFGAVATGDNGVLMFGVAGQAYTSHDGGQSWQAVALNTGQDLTAALVLRSGAIVLTSEDGALYVSNDHARSFTRLPAMVPMAPYSLAQAPDGDVIVAGSAGIVKVPAEDFGKN